MSLERGRITHTIVDHFAVRQALQLAFSVLVVASLLAVAGVGRAIGAERSWRAYLAPAGACPGATAPRASPAVQRLAVTCLVNWARAQDRRARLASSPALVRAASLKGRRVASCGQLSHAPCGSDLTSAVRAVDYDYTTFGENLFAGAPGDVPARQVVAAWLRSPGHRETLLAPGFREVGAARVRAPGLLGRADAAVWVTAFATRR